ncbi:MAG: hypothetical protein DRI56_10780 [Chloroflexota bacterium]|nr:MAG: hypothetical protein DRI56_10780 [Chloroflexota bacterium]
MDYSEIIIIAPFGKFCVIGGSVAEGKDKASVRRIPLPRVSPFMRGAAPEGCSHLPAQRLPPKIHMVQSNNSQVTIYKKKDLGTIL